MSLCLPLGSRCRRANPRPWSLDASVSNSVGRDSLKGWTTIGEHNNFLAVLNSCWWTGNHRKAFPFFNNVLIVGVMPARSGINAPSWLTRPRNDRTSVTFFGVGKSAIAAILSGSGRTPDALTTNPANLTLSPRAIFLLERRIPAERQRSNTFKKNRHCWGLDQHVVDDFEQPLR